MRLPVLLNANNQVQDRDGVVVCDLYRNPNALEDGRRIVGLLNGEIGRPLGGVSDGGEVIHVPIKGEAVTEVPITANGVNGYKANAVEELSVLKAGRITRQGKQWTEERKRAHGRKVREANARKLAKQDLKAKKI